MGRMLGSFDPEDELDRPDLNKCPDCGCYFASDECPLCGKTVVRGKYSYGCSGFREGCGFRINLRILGTPVPKKQIAKILAGEKTDEMSFVGKSGKPFTARLDLDEDKKLRFSFFPRSKGVGE